MHTAGSRSSTPRFETASSRRASRCSRREGGDRRAARAPRRGRDRGGLRRSPRPATSRACARSRGRSSTRPSPRWRGPNRDDVDAAVEALAGARRSRLHVFIATSPHAHGAQAPPRARGGARAGARSRSRYAAGRADEVEFSAEDATRSDPTFLAEVCREAIAAGATTVNLPDTVGYCLPAEYAAFLGRGAAPLSRSSTSVTSPSTATTTSGSRSRTRSPASPPARARSSARSTGSASGPGNAALEEIVMALRVRGRRVRRRDRASTSARSAHVRARLAADRLRRPAQQGDRRRERLRARGRHPPGRDAQGRRDLPDHRSRGARPDDDAPARQALRPPRVRARLRRRRHRARRRRAASRVRSASSALADERKAVTLYDVFEEVPASMKSYTRSPV